MSQASQTRLLSLISVPLGNLFTAMSIAHLTVRLHDMRGGASLKYSQRRPINFIDNEFPVSPYVNSKI